MWLTENYETQGKIWQAGEQYRALLQTVPPDENALRAWIKMLHRHGKTQDALRCYQDVQSFVEMQGFTLSPAIGRFVASLDKPPLGLHDLDAYTSHLKEGASTALQIGSQLRYLEAFDLYQQVPKPGNKNGKYGILQLFFKSKTGGESRHE